MPLRLPRRRRKEPRPHRDRASEMCPQRHWFVENRLSDGGHALRCNTRSSECSSYVQISNDLRPPARNNQPTHRSFASSSVERVFQHNARSGSCLMLRPEYLPQLIGGKQQNLVGEEERVNVLGLILFAAISLFWVASAETESEIVEQAGDSYNDREILDVQTEEELRSILSEVGQKLIPSHCSDWNKDESRVAGVMNLRRFEELWIGSEYSDSEGLGINGLQRRYEINHPKSGSCARG